jgi:hypothetical protein
MLRSLALARDMDDESPHSELALGGKLTIPDLIFDVIAEEAVSLELLKLGYFTSDRLSDFSIVPSSSHCARQRDRSFPFTHERHHHAFVFVY